MCTLTLRKDGRLRHSLLLAMGVLLAGASVAIGHEAPSKRAAADLGQAESHAARLTDLALAPSMVAEPAKPSFQPPHPLGGVSGDEYERRKALAARLQSATSRAAAPPPTPGVIGRETPGASVAFKAQSEAGLVPSDMALAVSGKYVVQVVNAAIGVYDRSGHPQTGFPKALTGLFPNSSGDLGDPRAFFDWNAARFVVTADDFTKGVVWLAASATSNPKGAWHIYSFAPWGAANCRASGNACADFPQVGFDDSTIYIGVNLFPAAGGIDDFMLLLPKATIYSGGGFGYNFWSNLRFGSTNVDTVQPVTPLTRGEHARAGFGVNSFNINYGGGQCVNGCSGLGVWAFSNNLQASGSPGPELSGITTATANTYSLPAQANEPGCSNCIDTGDVRISGTPTYHAGIINASLNTNGSDGHSHVLWFQLVPVLNDNDPRCTGVFLNACPQVTSASLLNEDCYFCGGEGAAGSTYYGTLAPDGGGDLTMVFNYSDDNGYPETAYASRRATQAHNTMHDSGIVLCSGAADYVQGRWGDYTAAVGDITNSAQNFMWFSGMNSLSNGNWGTCVGENGFTSGTQP